MKKLVSRFFIPIYESYFSKLNIKKPVKETLKIADAIFHEREFIEWLRIKYKDKLTSKTYPKFADVKNFNLYLKAYKQIKDRREEKEKRKLILDQVRLMKLKSVSKHEYDIDIVDAYLKIEHLVNTIKTNIGFNKEDYLNAMKQPVINYCAQADLPISQILEMKHPIIILSNSIGFEAYLGRTLIAFDVNKIEAILGYQNAIWMGNGLFASFIEHGVYNYVKNNSPFDNNIRLAKIMNWVERNRYFLPPHDASKKKTEKTPTLDYGIKKTDVNQLHYWPYSEDSLKALYKALLLNNKIKRNDSFCEPFRKYEDFPKDLTEWVAPQVQLMYLLYLIYKEENHHKGHLLHTIAMKLFKNGKGDFDPKVLNTTCNQLIKDFQADKPLSIGLKSIKTIFDDLDLN
ncbi:MAG: hypothetical protein ACK5QC_13125 [Bacteroidota bacterium]